MWTTKLSNGHQRCILLKEESRALHTHCYAHALNFAVADTVKQSNICRDALDVAYEVSKLIKFSPKRNAVFDCIKASSDDHDGSSTSMGIRSFCPTQWTVRGVAIESIFANYSTLLELWEEYLQPPCWLDPDVKARIIGVQSQIQIRLKPCERIF